MPRPPSLRRRRAGLALKRLREEAGLTLEEAAAATNGQLSKPKIGRIETFVGAMSGDDAYILCQVYGTDVTTTEALVDLARQSKQRGWWHVYPEDVLGKAAGVVELEADSTKICNFTIDLIPGLLQAEDYARALTRAANPTVDAEDLDQRIALRMERQRQVRGRDMCVQAIVAETALMIPVGGHKVMAEQLDVLAQLTSEPKIMVQVLPMSTGAHAAVGVPFGLFDLGDAARYGYIDTPAGGGYVEEERDIARYAEVWEFLQVAALDYIASRKIIQQWAAQHRQERGS